MSKTWKLLSHFILPYWEQATKREVYFTCSRQLKLLEGMQWFTQVSRRSISWLTLIFSSRTRLLRANLLQPLKDIKTINARLDCLVSFNQILSSLTLCSLFANLSVYYCYLFFYKSAIIIEFSLGVFLFKL